MYAQVYYLLLMQKTCEKKVDTCKSDQNACALNSNVVFNIRMLLHLFISYTNRLVCVNCVCVWVFESHKSINVNSNVKISKSTAHHLKSIEKIKPLDK